MSRKLPGKANDEFPRNLDEVRESSYDLASWLKRYIQTFLNRLDIRTCPTLFLSTNMNFILTTCLFIHVVLPSLSQVCQVWCQISAGAGACIGSKIRHIQRNWTTK